MLKLRFFALLRSADWVLLLLLIFASATLALPRPASSTEVECGHSVFWDDSAGKARAGC